MRKLGVAAIVDTDGEPLRLAVKAEPDVVSPNEVEAEELVGHEFNDDDDRARAVAEIARLGAREAIMTVPDGCFGQVIESRAADAVPRARRRARVAVADRLRRRLPGRVRRGALLGRAPVDCLRYGVACGAESTQHIGAGILDPRKVERLLDEVTAEQIAVRPRSLSRAADAAAEFPLQSGKRAASGRGRC